MKTKHLISLVAVSLAICAAGAEGVAEIPTELIVIDSGWQDSKPNDIHLGLAQPRTHYPASVEVMPTEGGRMKYRVVFIPKPPGDFLYKYAVGIIPGEYKHLGEVLEHQGYSQISHQAVRLMEGMVYSGVWVKHKQNQKKKENKPEMATPNQPPD